ncbi:hypothetical protein [Vulcanisaeta distributa]|uniref:hypothetical protein n=1 Tax=Vulcanisaeta distributa TaxID=164451 RepID=UPI0006D01BE7|nr:hypothetical protein [Vulcanisaeta distributa]
MGQQSVTPRTAYILSLIGSILMVISSIAVLIFAGMLMAMPPHFYAFHRFGYYPMMSIIPLAPIFFVVIGIVGLVVSVLAMYFSLRLSRLSDVNAVHSTGIVLLILAIIGLFVANGFFIGFILLLIGSILAITWKP